MFSRLFYLAIPHFLDHSLLSAPGARGTGWSYIHIPFVPESYDRNSRWRMTMVFPLRVICYGCGVWCVLTLYRAQAKANEPLVRRQS